MLKLFVLVRCDLTPQQRTVQACHAVADFLIRHGCKSLVVEWNEHSKVIVVLGVEDERQLKLELLQIEGREVEHACFFEPDMGHQMTAIAALPVNSLFFRKLELEGQ